MSIYKRYSHKTKCMYFMIKDEKILINISHFGKTWQYNKKKTNSELIYKNKYLKAVKNQHK